MSEHPVAAAPSPLTLEELLADMGEEATLGDVIRAIGEREKQRINSCAEQELMRLGAVVEEQLRKQYGQPLADAVLASAGRAPSSREASGAARDAIDGDARSTSERSDCSSSTAPPWLHATGARMRSARSAVIIRRV
eukprot:CAMPEP_0176078522 /NCGR_PEP_ID=MMETSP0120_2-20121206/39267_1 /TAXON_ID=160619 /ORGANISM="Kryptoperidinium foliaceum, Strain CCMP 1326" /LENGTH=136 /DNA_ID=CAMNT_0017412267 /DNA_START=83 /DNA_END=494 /DNA_ORIENTATION=-